MDHSPATPFLVVDVDVLRANIRTMADAGRAAGWSLRPHVKTHKVPQIARMQVEAGARGITVATIGEAEDFVEAGFDDVLIAYPVWLDDERAARLQALRSRATVMVGLDSVESARRIAEVAPGATVLVEVDSGHHRTGAQPQDAGDVAAAARDLGLDVAGVFTFPGHSYSPTGRRESAGDESAALASARSSLRAAGIEPRVVSGGATPSAAFSDPDVITELRPGVYVFHDAQQWELGVCSPADVALTVHATVVSHAGGRLVLDAGSKALGADRAPWATGFGRLLDHPEARCVILSEHHLVAELPEGVELPALGSVVRVVPNHACNAVNLADELWVEEAGEIVDRWPVVARNRNA